MRARRLRLHDAANLSDADAARSLAMHNVVAQLAHLRTHPSVAAGLASGDLRLHGWLFEIETGAVLALDKTTGTFAPLRGTQTGPVGQRPTRMAAGKDREPVAA